MTKVYCKKASYDYAVIKPVVFEMMDLHCAGRIRAGSRVLIKPNLLAPAPPDKAIVTHPLIVKAAAEYALERGARVQVSDSQAMGTFERVLKESGIKEALRGLDVEWRELNTSVAIDIGEPFNRIEIARDVMEADVVINLPKLKTHAQMLLTLGIKNLFGCIVGLKKPEWHFRTGVNREMFAQLLVRIHKAVNPAVTLLDGILAMEGEGPGRSGVPREVGVIMGSSDAVALDVTVCRMLGLDPFSVFTNEAAKDLGYLPEEIEVKGELPEIRGYRFPEIVPLVFGPKALHGFMRRYLVQRPVQDDALCRLCGECWKYCPARAITRDRQKLAFDYEKCIRCYCCIEVCPHAALRTEEPLPGRLFKRLKRDSF
ncbi:MAG: DUF362 domain-containing protein [Alphaproteobacteria bacterium]|uniref:DUF362 domain-containing protein n=1 Tax=Candidatus Nitrobium versatile TaxID=2884831 RepID=A0A953M1A8_9BACT|nr:DUF362 domain-containing protein [Candidatus Nitrobium versatile]